MRNLLNFDRIDELDVIAGKAKFYLIGEIATEFGLDPKTIRFYEKEGLLSPERHGKFRVFNSRDARVLQTVLRLRKFGLSIASIREIVCHRNDNSNSGKQHEFASHTLAKQLDELKKQRENIDLAIADIIKLLNV